MPLRSKQPHTGQTANPFNRSKGSVFAICSLYEHVFLVTSDEVAGSVFLNGDGFFLIIKLYKDAKHFLVIEHQTNVRTDVDGIFFICIIINTRRNIKFFA